MSYQARRVKCYTMGCDGYGYLTRLNQREAYCTICATARRRKLAEQHRCEKQRLSKPRGSGPSRAQPEPKFVTILHDPAGDFEPGQELKYEQFQAIRWVLDEGTVFEFDGVKQQL